MRKTLFSVALAVLTPPAASLTYAPATDAELVDRAATIVLGQVVRVRETPSHRYLTVAVDGVLKGSAGATVTIRQVGGTEWVVPGAPQAVLGDRGAWFLDAHGRADSALGWMHRVGARYVSIDGEARNAGRFRAWVVDRAVGRRRPADYRPVGPVAVAQPYRLYTRLCGSGVMRWRRFPTWSANSMDLSGTKGSVGWSDLVASAKRWEAVSAASLPLSLTSTEVTPVVSVLFFNGEAADGSRDPPGHGFGYTDPPTVTFSAPRAGGRRAVGVAVLDTKRDFSLQGRNIDYYWGGVERVDVSDSGDYDLFDDIEVTFSAPVDKGSLSRLRWSRGSGYVAPPAVTVSDPPAGGTAARLEAWINNGEVVDIVPIDRGAGYTSAPTVSIAAPPEGGTQAEVLRVETKGRTAVGSADLEPDFDRLPTPTHISDTGYSVRLLERGSFTVGRAWIFCGGSSYDAGNLGPATEPSRVYVTIARDFLDYYSPDDWRGVMTHELGHALGLDHSSTPAAIMWGSIRPGRGYHLARDDIAGIRKLYGAGSNDPDPEPPPPPPTISAANARAPESAGEVIFDVRLSAAAGSPVTVAYATRDGAAKAGEDYTATEGTLRFPAGSTSRRIRVPVTDDARYEAAPETFTLTLRRPVNATLAGGGESLMATGTILDDDDPQAEGPCVADALTRCLRDSRYAVTVDWRNAVGQSGAGRVASEGTDDSALFTFFDRDNWEVLIKVLDGCSVNGHAWVYGASTTDLGYVIRVTDTATGAVKEYHNEPGLRAPAITDVTAFPDGCEP